MSSTRRSKVKESVWRVLSTLAVGVLIGLVLTGCTSPTTGQCTEPLSEWVILSDTVAAAEAAESAPRITRLVQQYAPSCAFRGPEGEEAAIFIVPESATADELRATVVDSLRKADYAVASEVDGDKESGVTLLGGDTEKPSLATISTFWTPPSTWKVESNSIVVLIAVS
jgi:hypothetical protein